MTKSVSRSSKSNICYSDSPANINYSIAGNIGNRRSVLPVSTPPPAVSSIFVKAPVAPTPRSMLARTISSSNLANSTGPTGPQGEQGPPGIPAILSIETSTTPDESGITSSTILQGGQPLRIWSKTLDIRLIEGSSILGIEIPEDFWRHGPTGAIGPQGLKGDIGQIGPQGLRGIKGDIGPQGIKGDKGDKGDVGQIGPKGNNGTIGPQGLRGIKGDVGPQGTKGDGAY